MTWRGLVGSAFLALLGLAAPALADPLSKGRQMAERFLKGDVDAIWSASTPDMRQAFGSAGDLQAFYSELRENWGEEDAIVAEYADVQAGYDVYTRVSTWTQATSPVELVISLNGADQIAGFYIRPQPAALPSRFLEYETKAELRLPVNGEWHVLWGGREIENNYHAVDVGQRFALDMLIMEDGKSHSGDPTDLESYHCWERRILAPAEGVVVEVVDGLPDQDIGATDPENPAGNHVVIDFGNDEFGFLAHMRQGSVAVSLGDEVAAGQEIGLCGNSGNTSEPHLHFHLQNSPRLGQGEGLPAQFNNYQANGTHIDRGEPQKGQVVRSAD